MSDDPWLTLSKLATSTTSSQPGLRSWKLGDDRLVSGIAFGLQPVPPRAAAVASRAVWRRSPRPMGACENPNLPVEMAEGRVKYRANEPAAHDTTRLPEPYPRIRSIRSSSTP